MISVRARLSRGGFELDATLESDAPITGLFGPSGCGKTTLLEAIAGTIRPQEGRIEIDGKVLYSSAERVSVSPKSRRCGYVFQDDRLFPHLNVRDNILFGYRRIPSGARRFELGEIVSLLGLDSMLARRVTELSGGERRRTSLARALLYSPRILLLDEPLTGLDRPLRRRVLGYLLRIKEVLDIRMLYVSHTFSDLLALADVMCVMRDGRIVGTGPPHSLLADVVDDEGAGPLETVIRGRIAEVHPPDGTATFEADGLDLRVPCEGMQAGEIVLVTIRAEDVIVAVDSQPITSARNVIAGRVTEVRHLASRVVLRVDAGPGVLVEVTESAARELKLEPGRDVFLLLKTRSLRTVSVSGRSSRPSPPPHPRCSQGS